MISTQNTETCELILGTAQLCSAYGVTSSRDSERGPGEAVELLQAAFEYGFTAVDTAPAYGAAENMIGLSGIDFTIHTKLSADAPSESLEASLRRLGRVAVDTVYIHDPTAVMRGEDWLTSIACNSGHRAKRLGASIYESAEFAAAEISTAITAIQVPFNLLNQEIGREMIAAGASRGSAIYARSVLLQGALAVAPESLPRGLRNLKSYTEALAKLASRHDRTLVELAIAWVRDTPGIHGLVLGADSVEQVASLASAFKTPRLSDAEIAAISNLSTPAAGTADPRSWSR